MSDITVRNERVAILSALCVSIYEVYMKAIVSGQSVSADMLLKALRYCEERLQAILNN